MFERLSLPSVGDLAQAATDLCASVSTTAADALALIEPPSLPSPGCLPELSSLGLPGWLFGGRDPVASDLALVSTAPSPATTSEGWDVVVRMSGLTWDHFFPSEDRDWSSRVDLDGLGRFLRAQHPDKPHQHVAARTKLPADTVKKWLLGVAAPSGRAMLVLACAYGPEIMVAMLRDPPGWLDAAARAAEQARLQAQLTALQAKLARPA